ncbi:uncharacterized protein FFMR_04931 [Fusarium fujikuroi]|nr:uncharacterized protein FFMR_04931 [Fusarium fujikuroi]
MASRLRQMKHNNFPARRTTSVGAFEAVEDVTILDNCPSQNIT